MDVEQLERLIVRQRGIIARRQLRQLGVTHNHVRWQIEAKRWTARSPRVVSTFTGSLTWLQQCWLGHLHAGVESLIGGVSAANLFQLANWRRDQITVLVPSHVVLKPVAGFNWVRTRRDLSALRSQSLPIPAADLAPAILLFGAAQRSARTAIGIVAAAIQQRLVSPAVILDWIERLQPLKRASLLRSSVADFAGGTQSVGEQDVTHMCRKYQLALPDRQVARRDASGRWRYRDCRWRLDTGRQVSLEVDGGFHMDVRHWQSDIARHRDLAHPLNTTVRCTTIELRTNPGQVAAALTRLGVPRSSPGVVLPGPRSSAAPVTQPPEVFAARA